MNKFSKWDEVKIINSYKGLMKFIVVMFVFFMSIAPSAIAADNSNAMYEGTHNFSECLERLGCYDISNWGPCGAHSWPFSEQAAYEKAMDHIEFTLLEKANVAAEVKNIKKCFNGCNAWFDQKVSGEWKYVGDGMWEAAPGNYRLNILSDGYKGCGVPYKQTSFCPSSCTVKLNVYPVDPSVEPNDAVIIAPTSPKPIYPPCWHVDEQKKLGLKRVVRYIRKRAHILEQTDIPMAALLDTYADKIENADIYYKDNSWYNRNGEASTSLLGNITIYSNMTKTYEPFWLSKGMSCTDEQLGVVASLIMHEIKHKYGGDEWEAHDLQKKTFNALKVSDQAGARINVKQFFEKYPKPSIWVKFYWITG
ncbi:MAG TPA: hypothetical protein ENF70_03365 [Deltaproteobacteria bacterium]|nr:MAG: hypothetical protein DRP14_00705 [Candidatus Aenigmarchaeota archaeon]HDH98157.1 hypothetical protein [Deltaproteobacteria bacterium]